jgi:hypothetical protein
MGEDTSGRELKEAMRARLILSEWDLLEAQTYAGEILGAATTGAIAGTYTRRALNVALVVVYARAFKKNRPPSAGAVAEKLPDDVIDVLNADEKSLHEQVLTIRDREIAHSDPDARQLQVPYSTELEATIPMGRAPTVLPHDQVDRLGAMIEKLLIEVSGRRLRLDEELRP